jgi:two-component system phosphate regulon response regulator PhoB
MERILVIEDEGDIRQVLEYNLRQAGYDVTGVERGNAGLALARERPPDLVVLDLMLPDIPGLDVCRAMKADARLRKVAVIMLTAKGSEIDRIVGLELGADDYVTKPFSVRDRRLAVGPTQWSPWSSAGCASTTPRIAPGWTTARSRLRLWR